MYNKVLKWNGNLCLKMHQQKLMNKNFFLNGGLDKTKICVIAVDWVVSLPAPQFICWSLTPNTMVFRGGLVGRELGLAEAVRVGPRDGISAFKAETPESCPQSPHHVGAQWEGGCLRAKKGALTRNGIGRRFGLGLQPPVCGLSLRWGHNETLGSGVVILDAEWWYCGVRDTILFYFC